MARMIRDAPVGQVIRCIFGASVLPYEEEKPGFVFPGPAKPASTASQDTGPLEENTEHTDHGEADKEDNNSHKPNDVENGQEPKATVTWYGDQDPENPQNYSTAKKCYIQFIICFLTFAVYSGSSIIVTSETYFTEVWGVSQQASVLVLSMYVLGYGIGPLFFSPMSEVPRLGRNIPYVGSLSLFFCLTIAAATVNNYPGLVVVRFIQGFLGGPVLATGGASAADVFNFLKLPYALSLWVLFAYGGPGLGPLLSGYAVQESTWRWSMYETLIISGICWLLVVFSLPETNGETILLRRAQRLRKLTGRNDLMTQSEFKQGNVHILSLIGTYLTTPFRVSLLDPSIFFINLYTALLYGLYYTFFESFPIVYVQIYGFSIGLMGVVFVTLIIGCLIALSIYITLVYYIYEPYTLANGIGKPEYRMVPGIYASALVPVGVFIFAWCARPDINWAVPTIGILIIPGASAILGMVIFLYLPTSYPHFAASLFAANTFLRSAMAAGAIHFALPLFNNLGIGRGNSILGGLLVGCCLAFIVLCHFGPSLRAKSKFAGIF